MFTHCLLGCLVGLVDHAAHHVGSSHRRRGGLCLRQREAWAPWGRNRLKAAGCMLCLRSAGTRRSAWAWWVFEVFLIRGIDSANCRRRKTSADVSRSRLAVVDVVGEGLVPFKAAPPAVERELFRCEECGASYKLKRKSCGSFGFYALRLLLRRLCACRSLIVNVCRPLTI
ncbi:hypothetical protein HDV57DRAFT_497320 [Trichoderma longibrachiatum]